VKRSIEIVKRKIVNDSVLLFCFENKRFW
jgi:hypothetical protein